MSFIRFVIWTSASVAFGVFLAGADLAGKTPLEHLQRFWERHGQAAKLDNLKAGVRDALGEAREATKPSEHYTFEDREALNKIVAKRTVPK
jgi:hypothetical protein